MENIGWLQFVFLSECVLSNLRWMFNGKYIIPLKYWIRLGCWVRRIGKVLGETDPILTSIQFILDVSLLGTNRLTTGIGLTISWITKEAIAAVSANPIPHFFPRGMIRMHGWDNRSVHDTADCRPSNNHKNGMYFKLETFTVYTKGKNTSPIRIQKWKPSILRFRMEHAWVY